MPNVTVISSGNFDDGYNATAPTTYNETNALLGRNSATSLFDNQTSTLSIAAHGRIFGRAYNYRPFMAFDLSGNDDDGGSLSGNTVSAATLQIVTLADLTGFVNYTAETGDQIYVVKATASSTFNAASNYNDIDGWVSSGTYNGNVTQYGNANQAAGATITVTLNSTAISDINSAIGSGGNFKIALLTEDEFLSRTGTNNLGGMPGSSNLMYGIRFNTGEATDAANRPKLSLTYGAASGYSKDVIGVDSGDIVKVNGVATADIQKIIGV
jgi:hypothetical protein